METLDVRTRDGWSVRVDVREPSSPVVGLAVLAHAEMACRTTFDRPSGKGVARLLVERGWRVIAFDFRGHGDSGVASGQRGSWGYDDLVFCDMPAVFSFAQSRADGLPLVAVGHSLGGHVTLATQGTGRVAFDGIVVVGACVWTRELEPSFVRWRLKRAALRAALAVCWGIGRFPARSLRAGSDDESRVFLEDYERFSRRGWTSRDGLQDYSASLANVRCRVLQVVSEGDRLICPPECGERMVAPCGGPHAVERVGNSDDGGPAPGHAGIVTSGTVPGVWRRVEAWMRAGS